MEPIKRRRKALPVDTMMIRNARINAEKMRYEVPVPRSWINFRVRAIIASIVLAPLFLIISVAVPWVAVLQLAPLGILIACAASVLLQEVRR